MKCLVIRVQPEMDTAHSYQEIVALSRAIGCFPEIDTPEEEDGPIYLNYFSEQLPALWQQLQRELFKHPELGHWLARVSVVVCEGENSWEDARLLHHFDANEQLDVLEGI